MSDLSEKKYAGLTPVSVEEFLLPYLHCRNHPATAGQICSWLKNYAGKPEVEGGLDSMAAMGLIEAEKGKLRLTVRGCEVARATFGERRDDARCKNILWPAMALGLDPKSRSAARLKTPSVLAAVFLTRLYQLPLDFDTVTLDQAACGLAVRGLVGHVSLAATHPGLRDIAESLSEKPQAANLRVLLIRAALELNRADRTGVSTKADGAVSPPPEPEPDGLKEFARNIHTIVERLSTPPFSDSVAIAQVYDAYGRQFPGAGSLGSFKQRLLAAHISRHLSLATLDRPEALNAELRDRSEIQGQRCNFHLVIRQRDK